MLELLKKGGNREEIISSFGTNAGGQQQAQQTSKLSQETQHRISIFLYSDTTGLQASMISTRIDCFICPSTKRLLSQEDIRLSLPDEVLLDLGFLGAEGKLKGLYQFSSLYQPVYDQVVKAGLSDFPSTRSPPEYSLITATSARALVAMALGGYLVVLGTGQILSHFLESTNLSAMERSQMMKAAQIFKVP